MLSRVFSVHEDYLPETLDGGITLAVAPAVLCMLSHILHIKGGTLPASQKLVHLPGVEHLQPACRNHLQCITGHNLDLRGT